MSCSTNLRVPFRVVWSAGSTSSTVEHAFTGPINAATVHKVRLSFELRGSSGQTKVAGFYQYSDDGESWDASQALGPSFTTTEGWSYGTSFTDISTGTPATRKLYVRFGIAVKNGTGTEIEYGRARLQLDFEGAG